MIGRRRSDRERSNFPEDIEPGDYWKLIGKDGQPLQSDEPSNLTGTCWIVAAPRGDGYYMLGNLSKHTVREHEDGTISVLPGDGSSNSILISRRPEEAWHGYIRHGVWEEA